MLEGNGKVSAGPGHIKRPNFPAVLVKKLVFSLAELDLSPLSVDHPLGIFLGDLFSLAFGKTRGHVSFLKSKVGGSNLHLN